MPAKAQFATDTECNRRLVAENTDSNFDWDYFNLVKTAADAADGRPILNRSPEHASIILEILFTKAEKHVRVVTNKLDPSVWVGGRVLGAVRSFLAKPGSSIDILVECPSVGDIDFVRIIGGEFPDKVRISSVPAKLQEKYGWNFVVVDGRHFRFEQNRQELRAFIQFGNESEAMHLEDLFEKLKKRACE